LDIAAGSILIFSTTLEEEAGGFIVTNTYRNEVSRFDVHRASLVANHPMAIYVQKTLDDRGISLVTGGGLSQHHRDVETTRLSAIGACYSMASKDKRAYERTLDVSKQICVGRGIPEAVLVGIYYAYRNIASSYDDVRFNKRLVGLSLDELIHNIGVAKSYYVDGGIKVWSMGVLNTINKGLSKKFKFDFEPQE
jgi:hypothetical protein